MLYYPTHVMTIPSLVVDKKEGEQRSVILCFAAPQNDVWEMDPIRKSSPKHPVRLPHATGLRRNDNDELNPLKDGEPEQGKRNGMTETRMRKGDRLREQSRGILLLQGGVSKTTGKPQPPKERNTKKEKKRRPRPCDTKYRMTTQSPSPSPEEKTKKNASLQLHRLP